MHYYIDGYNLLFRLAGSKINLQKERQKIIQDLTSKIALINIDCTIVFDATYQIGESSRSHFKMLEIVFTAEGETADEYIITELASTLNPRQETVITSDKTLASHARRSSAKTESIDEFMGWLNQRAKNRLKSPPKSELKLRQAKKSPQPLSKKESPDLEKTPLKKSNPDKSSELKLPSSNASAMECFDYYQHVFETQYEIVAKEQTAKKQLQQCAVKSKENRKSRKSFTKKETPEEIENTSLCSMVRWLEIFEKRHKDSK